MNKFEYKQKVRFKASPTDTKSFYEGQVGFIIAMQERTIVSEKQKFYTYLVQLDDKFEYREWCKESNLEAV